MSNRYGCFPFQNRCCTDVVNIREVHVCPWTYSIIYTSPVHKDFNTSLEQIYTKGFRKLLIGMSSFGPSILCPNFPVNIHDFLDFLFWYTISMQTPWNSFVPHEI